MKRPAVCQRFHLRVQRNEMTIERNSISDKIKEKIFKKKKKKKEETWQRQKPTETTFIIDLAILQWARSSRTTSPLPRASNHSTNLNNLLSWLIESLQRGWSRYFVYPPSTETSRKTFRPILSATRNEGMNPSVNRRWKSCSIQRGRCSGPIRTLPMSWAVGWLSLVNAIVEN